MIEYKKKRFPKTRVATIDICTIGLEKHHIPAFIEIDVTESRKKIREKKREGKRISFTSWLIKVIGDTIKDHETVAAFLNGKGELIVFHDINVSMIVEKSLNGQKIPIPLVIEKVQERSVESICKQIADARSHNLEESEIVLQSSSAGVSAQDVVNPNIKRVNSWAERAYYYLPGFIRRYFWRYLLRHPKIAFSKMGNVSVTSLGMVGSANGWFVPVSVHPVCFGVGKVTKKPMVVEDRVEIREILNMTVLMDHDVIDGAPMARFIGDLTSRVCDCYGLT
ncbi:MAG: 2-oxo acid dehydrogenase subunit E2 [Bacteroidales bacterium]|jgi:pyruvate/2-oxoglutarate dehydrogenase complex dihydrolipoamide acyltransferase (E2) component|nr:2-oxo acid dehydrogenase subunit E2 [Bacteroidales bacterium]